MEDIWEILCNLLNYDCMLIIRSYYYKNQKKYCINQIKNMMDEQSELITMYENGVIMTKPNYNKHLFLLEMIKHKIELNSKTIFKERGCFDCRRYNRYNKKRCCSICGVCRKKRCEICMGLCTDYWRKYFTNYKF